MAATSPDQWASAILHGILAGRDPDLDQLARLTAAALHPDTALLATKALFRDLIEPLNDRFELRLVDAYTEVFAHVIAQAIPTLAPSALHSRYQGLRLVRQYPRTPQRIVVLSRVTLGADIAVTSVLLSAAAAAYPHAELYFAGPAKNFQLLSRCPGLRHADLPYAREATLAERFSIYPALRELCQQPGTLTLDADSRLSQLGLLPICSIENLFFESRCYQESSTHSLGQLARHWCDESLGLSPTGPTLWMPRQSATSAIAVNLGVGGNEAKRIDDHFERELLSMLTKTGRTVILDQGGGGEETDRVRRISAGLDVQLFAGSLFHFAEQIAACDLYVGYDSAGQHAAAALGVPVVNIFQGAVNPRFRQRWTPAGSAPVIVIDQPHDILAHVEQAVLSLLR